MVISFISYIKQRTYYITHKIEHQKEKILIEWLWTCKDTHI